MQSPLKSKPEAKSHNPTQALESRRPGLFVFPKQQQARHKAQPIKKPTNTRKPTNKNCTKQNLSQTTTILKT